jgi:hypothetical protein
MSIRALILTLQQYTHSTFVATIQQCNNATGPDFDAAVDVLNIAVTQAMEMAVTTG